jgi:hypothetical protein
MNTINHPPYPLANGRKLQRKNHNGGHSPLLRGVGGVSKMATLNSQTLNNTSEN